MKFMFASDIHGSAYYCRKLLEAMEKEQPKKLLKKQDMKAQCSHGSPAWMEPNSLRKFI